MSTETAALWGVKYAADPANVEPYGSKEAACRAVARHAGPGATVVSRPDGSSEWQLPAALVSDTTKDPA